MCKAANADFMDEEIGIYMECPKGNNPGADIILLGCLSDISAQISFEGLSVETELDFTELKAKCVAALLIAGLVEHKTGFLSGGVKFVKGKIWGKEASTADEEKLHKIMEQLTPDDQKQAVEIAGELIRAESQAESQEAAAVEKIVEQPKKRPPRTGGRKTTRTRR